MDIYININGYMGGQVPWIYININGYMSGKVPWIYININGYMGGQVPWININEYLVGYCLLSRFLGLVIMEIWLGKLVPWIISPGNQVPWIYVYKYLWVPLMNINID